MSESAYVKNRSTARMFSTVVYFGGVLAATMLFISFILLAFPPDAYFSRLIMSIAGVMVGASMLAFPYALHNWAITKNHRQWTTALYYIEMLIVMVNTVVSFVSLLAKFAGYAAPEWVVLYEPFSVASIIYTVFAWGTVFLLDPEHKLVADERETEARFLQKIAEKREAFIDSVQGEDVIARIVSEDVVERFSPERFRKGKRDFGTGRVGIPAPAVFTVKESNVPLAGTGNEQE
jgi:hypothetical protein